ncbi:MULTISPECIES: tRNA1(Val) (adenine(37)-N6)-methyltransferase [Niastella]|uniref:Methyltransferase n=1 Tax=Niastella soli TaxID=2821487 RepID=A0ABS3Z381_9BACT|nr:methyltransferase [Niastella soli]MBO9204594.1 methyltransferase [Niastella soli]
MKVCTDACLLGAWFSKKIPQHATVLDIGAGTGLLMMMLAQRSQSEIHGIEIDPAAYEQLQENTSQNDWKQRLQVFAGDARTYSFPHKYDYIISNPPFFESDWLSTDNREQIAKHSTLLTLDELIHVIAHNLQPQGSFGILLPFHRWEYFDKLAGFNGFFLQEKVVVKQTPRHAPFRVLLQYTRNPHHPASAIDLTIQQIDGAYTGEFVGLLKDYYLYL